jgi:4-diphosphocytidyl-2-C-methyl-D-erythritol kinase
VQSFAAPAKLNLMLRVVGRRPDGYHLLETVFRLIEPGDEVRIQVRGDGELRRLHPTAPGIPEESDLTMRAARLLKEVSRSPLGADIGVVKRVPLGAGLGGGSSDAATVLLALNHLWQTGLTREELQALGLRLGADVPFFVFGESAFATGVGEVFTSLALPPAWYVVLTPEVEVPTARIFAHPELKRDSKPIKIQRFSADSIAGHAANDLEALVCRLYPEVARHLDWLRQHEPAHMTGSGSSVFAEFGSESAAQYVFDQRPADMRGFVARGLERHPLWGLAG